MPRYLCPTRPLFGGKLSYRLPAKWVIHTVGPIWRGGQANENELLASCYRNSLALAEEHGIKTIAFPSISTGAFGFPMERAAKIAITEVQKFLAHNQTLGKVIFVCFGEQAARIYRSALGDGPSSVM